MRPLVPEILQSREAIKNKMKFAFFLLGGSILLLSADKRNERSSNPGLRAKMSINKKYELPSESRELIIKIKAFRIRSLLKGLKWQAKSRDCTSSEETGLTGAFNSPNNTQPF